VRIDGTAADLEAGRVEIANRQHFRDLSWLLASYSLTADGTEIAGGAVELPGWAPEAGSGEEFLTVRITTAEASDWAPHGFEVCAVQLPLREDKAPVAVAEPAADTDAALPLADDGLLRHPAFAAPRPSACGVPRPTTTASAAWRPAGRRPGSIAWSAASSA